MIKRKKIDMSEERRILTYMITSTRFLDSLKDIAQPKYFKSRYCQIVAGWVWEYFGHTNEAPSKHIEDIFINKQTDLTQDEDEADLIGEFLRELSDWSDTIQNIPYTTKQATFYFKLQHLEHHKQDLEAAIQSKDVDAAEQLIAGYNRIDKVKSQGVDLLEDTNRVRNAFTTEHNYLFSFPRELGKCVGTFERGDFVSFMGGPKKGKSWWLIYLSVHALRMGMRVLYINLEMTEDPVIRRFWQCITGEPVKKTKVAIPKFVEKEDGDYSVEMINLNKKV